MLKSFPILCDFTCTYLPLEKKSTQYIVHSSTSHSITNNQENQQMICIHPKGPGSIQINPRCWKNESLNLGWNCQNLVVLVLKGIQCTPPSNWGTSHASVGNSPTKSPHIPPIWCKPVKLYGKRNPTRTKKSLMGKRKRKRGEDKS